MSSGYITVIHPEHVAREVERQVKLGCRAFVLRAVAGGGMLDQERIGAARPAGEIARQIALTRRSTEAPGHIHWSMKALMKKNGVLGSPTIRFATAD